MAEYRGLIPGTATEQGRPKTARIKNHITVYDPAKCRNYKAYAKGEIAKFRLTRLLDGPLGFEVIVYVLKPKSWPKKRIHPDTKPDWDNFAKMIADCCEGLVYTNDSRIVDARIRKVLTLDNPRVEIRCWEIDGTEVSPEQKRIRELERVLGYYAEANFSPIASAKIGDHHCVGSGIAKAAKDVLEVDYEHKN